MYFLGRIFVVRTAKEKGEKEKKEIDTAYGTWGKGGRKDNAIFPGRALLSLILFSPLPLPAPSFPRRRGGNCINFPP